MLERTPNAIWRRAPRRHFCFLAFHPTHNLSQTSSQFLLKRRTHAIMNGNSGRCSMMHQGTHRVRLATHSGWKLLGTFGFESLILVLACQHGWFTKFCRWCNGIIRWNVVSSSCMVDLLLHTLLCQAPSKTRTDAREILCPGVINTQDQEIR